MIKTEEIKELHSNTDWQKAYPILKTLRADLIEDHFLSNRESLISNGYTLIGLFDSGELISVAGVDLYPHITRGIDCWIHDLATKENLRSNGYGKRLMQYIENWAKSKGCSRLCVHTRVEKISAQNFYEQKLNYKKSAITYYKEL